MRRRRAPSQGRSTPRDHKSNSYEETKRQIVPRRSLSLPPGKVNHGRVDISKIGSRVAQGKLKENYNMLIICFKVIVYFTPNECLIIFFYNHHRYQ